MCYGGPGLILPPRGGRVKTIHSRGQLILLKADAGESSAKMCPKYENNYTDIYDNSVCIYHWNFNLCYPVAYLGFRKKGPNFLWPLVLTERGPHQIFQI